MSRPISLPLTPVPPKKKPVATTPARAAVGRNIRNAMGRRMSFKEEVLRAVEIIIKGVVMDYGE